MTAWAVLALLVLNPMTPPWTLLWTLDFKKRLLSSVFDAAATTLRPWHTGYLLQLTNALVSANHQNYSEMLKRGSANARAMEKLSLKGPNLTALSCQLMLQTTTWSANDFVFYIQHVFRTLHIIFYCAHMQHVFPSLLRLMRLNCYTIQTRQQTTGSILYIYTHTLHTLIDNDTSTPCCAASITRYKQQWQHRNKMPNSATRQLTFCNYVNSFYCRVAFMWQCLDCPIRFGSFWGHGG